MFEDIGSILNLKYSGIRKMVRTPENIGRVQAAVMRSPRHSSRKQASELNISNTLLLGILYKDLNFRPYKI